MIGGASIVLLGEASHGTHEFYRQRAEITKRLIVEKGFNAVAVEADWPDAYRVNRFVRGEVGDSDSVDALAGFNRFPSWMWRNADVLDFIGWLRDHNEHVYSSEHQVGFYGLDLYSLHKSIHEVIAYLELKDPEEAAKARVLYGCMDRFARDPQNYGLMVGAGLGDSCRAEVIQQLTDLRAKEVEYLVRDGYAAADEFFFAAQNARLVKNAEQLFHQVGIPNFWLDLTRDNPAVEVLKEPRLERAIGVVYLPESERQSHYFPANLAAQFDAVLHFDLTRAVEPLERTTEWSTDEAPETYPVGL